PVNAPRAEHAGHVVSPRAVHISASPADTNNITSIKIGTAHHIHGGSPNHSATWYNATKLMAKATNPASSTPPTTMRMNWPESGLIDRKSTRLNSSHVSISYAVFCL